MSYFEPYGVGTTLRIKIMEGTVEGVLGGYAYGISGNPTSFYFKDNPDIRYPLERLNDPWCTVLAPPPEYDEE